MSKTDTTIDLTLDEVEILKSAMNEYANQASRSRLITGIRRIEIIKLHKRIFDIFEDMVTENTTSGYALKEVRDE